MEFQLGRTQIHNKQVYTLSTFVYVESIYYCQDIGSIILVNVYA